MATENLAGAIEQLRDAPEWSIPDHLKGLAAIHPEVIIDLLQSFVLDTANRLERLRTRFQEGDLDAVAREAHNIRGSSGQMGVRFVSELCRLAEEAAARRAIELVREAIDALDRVFAEASRGIAQYVARTRCPERG